MSMFETAARLKLRFNSPKGELTVEDLWDLPLTSTVNKPNLDDIAKELHGQIDTNKVGSFVRKTTAVSQVDQLKFDIVLHVINVRLAENEAALKAAETKAKKQQIMELIQRKETEQLAGSSLEDLRALLDAM